MSAVLAGGDGQVTWGSRPRIAPRCAGAEGIRHSIIGGIARFGHNFPGKEGMSLVNPRIEYGDNLSRPGVAIENLVVTAN
jgi:hypothetical protein